MIDFIPSTGYDLLRILCGAFMLPNAWAKLVSPAASVGFFEKAGFPHPMLFVRFATAFEFVVGVGLVLGIQTVPLAWVATVFMLVATVADLRVNRAWAWTKGGCEYPLFWCICCGIVAANS